MAVDFVITTPNPTDVALAIAILVGVIIIWRRWGKHKSKVTELKEELNIVKLKRDIERVKAGMSEIKDVEEVENPKSLADWIGNKIKGK